MQQKARLLLRLKKYDEAGALYKKLLKVYPENYLFNKNLGICFYHMNMERQAARHLITAWNNNKRDLSLPVSIANAWARLKLPGKAMIALKDGLIEDSTNIPVLKTAGSISYSMGNDQSAADYFQKAYNYGDTSEFVYKYLGISYFNLSRFEEAIPFLRGYYSYDSLNTEATYYLGLALASWHYKEEGINMLQKTIDLSYPDPVFISSLYTGMAIAKADINHRDEAIDYYFKAIELDPGNTTSYIEVARLYDGKARIEKDSSAVKRALEYYERFLALEQKRLEVIMEQTGLEADKISIPGYDYAKRRVKEIREELFFRGELEK
jgi:tetratricopeptide (TPR) repeat protein